MSQVTCPACNSLQHRSECFLGAMGTLNHFRCRYCGMMWNKQRRTKAVLKEKADRKKWGH